VPYIDPENGDQRFLITPLFEFFDVAAADAVKRPTLKFGIPPKLRPVLARSNRWGRIKAEVVCAMSSRYAVALYELVQLRARMERSLEVFAVDRFRSLLGVPPESYQRGNDFVRFVLEPAALEVNGLSDLGVTVEVRRKGPRAPIEAVAVAWWRKEGDAFREALKERDRSKLGRTARLRGEVEAVTVSSRVTGTARKRL
jgi:plasmid replication initiation protein